MNPYEALANAIILQAVDDYRKAYKFLKKYPRAEEISEKRLLESIRSNERMVKETERFFHSEWFTRLTSLDGHTLFERIKKDMEGD